MTAFVDLFGGVLDSNTQKVNTADVLGGKVVGIYFGANWCRECRAFTQHLLQPSKSRGMLLCHRAASTAVPKGVLLTIVATPPPPLPPLPKNRRDSRRARSDAEVRDIGVQYSPGSEELLSTHISDTRCIEAHLV